LVLICRGLGDAAGRTLQPRAYRGRKRKPIALEGAIVGTAGGTTLLGGILSGLTMSGGIPDVYLGDVAGALRRGDSSPIRRVPGGAGADAVWVWRSVGRVGGFLGDAGAGGQLIGDDPGLADGKKIKIVI
jgi:hypothetical protein